MRVRFAATLAGCVVTLTAHSEVGGTTHPKRFWLELRAHQFELPAGGSPLPLALDAARLLGDTDPQWRDAVGYEALETWIYGKPTLTADEIGILRSVLVTNARSGLGQAQGDGLYLRSFSTLALSVIAAADLKHPVLDVSQFDELVDLALEQLARERDLRGYTPGKGWGHATAHCADLLKFLGRSPHLGVGQQTRIVAGVEGRLRSAGIVFVWGEDARLALALASIARRADTDAGPFSAWFERLIDEHRRVWAGPFDAPSYIAVRAQLNALSQLAAELESDGTPGALQDIRAGLKRVRAATR